jgi:hypothetical protein
MNETLERSTVPGDDESMVTRREKYLDDITNYLRRSRLLIAANGE